MTTSQNMPTHPHSGLRALWVAPNGRAFYPIAGGDHTVEELSLDYSDALDEMEALETQYGDAQHRATRWPSAARSRWEHLQARCGALDADIQRLNDRAAREQRIEAVRAAAQNPNNREASVPAAGQYESGRSSRTRMRSDPWRGMGEEPIARFDTLDGLRERALDALDLTRDATHEARTLVGDLLGSRDDDDPVAMAQSRAASEYVLAASDPDYLVAFRKIVRDPEHGHLQWSDAQRRSYVRTEAARAAMSLSNSNGGYLVPFTLDPTIVLTNSGALNPWRQLCSIKTTATNTWNGVTSAGVTASWLAEATEAADASPTFGNIQITPQKASAYVQGSFEVLSDSDFADQLPMLIGDAKDRLEEAAFAVGTGTGQPKGVVTAAVAASKTVNSAGAAAFVVGDVYSLASALPDRWYGKGSFVANKTITMKLRQFDTAGGSAYWANLGERIPENLIGRTYRESTSLASTLTTGSKPLLYGDLSQYYIVDRLGMSLIYEPLVKGANRRPTGEAGWFAYWRTGGDLAVPDAVRVLNIA